MAGDHLPKKHFVFEFDARHLQQIADAFLQFQVLGARGGIFIFHGVPAFKPSGEIHRHEPSGNVTGQPKHTSDHPEHLVADNTRPCIEFCKPIADPSPMVPFLGLDRLYSFALVQIAERPPVSAVGICRSDLAGVGVLQDTDEVFSR